MQIICQPAKIKNLRQLCNVFLKHNYNFLVEVLGRGREMNSRPDREKEFGSGLNSLRCKELDQIKPKNFSVAAILGFPRGSRSFRLPLRLTAIGRLGL